MLGITFRADKPPIFCQVQLSVCYSSLVSCYENQCQINKSLRKKCHRVSHCSIFGAVNYREAGEAGISPAGTLLTATRKTENALTAGHGGQLWEEREKEKKIAC